ncbi:hypothetical protein U1Q18_016896 [Sarracenia purpurea var. burkii]
MKNGRLRRGAEWRWRKNRGFVVPVESAAFSPHRERRWACLCRFGDPKGILKFGLRNFAITNFELDLILNFSLNRIKMGQYDWTEQNPSHAYTEGRRNKSVGQVGRTRLARHRQPLRGNPCSLYSPENGAIRLEETWVRQVCNTPSLLDWQGQA